MHKAWTDCMLIPDLMPLEGGSSLTTSRSEMLYVGISANQIGFLSCPAISDT